MLKNPPVNAEGTWVWKDPTSHRAARPVHHSYGARAPKPEKSPQGEAHMPQLESSPRSLQLEKAGMPQPNPSTAKTKQTKSTGLRLISEFLNVLSFKRWAEVYTQCVQSRWHLWFNIRIPAMNSRLWKRLRCWERLQAGGEGDDRGWDGWMASPTQRMGTWANSGRWWRTGKPGMLRSTGSWRVRRDLAPEQQHLLWKCLFNTRPLSTLEDPC